MRSANSLIYLILLILVGVICLSLVTTIDFGSDTTPDLNNPSAGDDGTQSPGGSNSGNHDSSGNNNTGTGSNVGNGAYDNGIYVILENMEQLKQYDIKVGGICAACEIYFEIEHSTWATHKVTPTCRVCKATAKCIYVKHENVKKYTYDNDERHRISDYCTVCEYDRPMNYSAHNLVDVGYRSINDYLHAATEKCADCNHLFHGEQTDHIFASDTHKCTTCGYACQHNGATPVYTNVSETGHRVDFVCKRCGYEEHYTQSHVRNLSGVCVQCDRPCDHNFDGGALCLICGLSCKHESTKQEIVMVDYENHAFKETCKSCNGVLYYGLAAHDFTEDNTHKCTNCEYCNHVFIDDGSGTIVCSYCGKLGVQ